MASSTVCVKCASKPCGPRAFEHAKQLYRTYAQPEVRMAKHSTCRSVNILTGRPYVSCPMHRKS
eukprot:1748646-Rhodomonas_salina.2